MSVKMLYVQYLQVAMLKKSRNRNQARFNEQKCLLILMVKRPSILFNEKQSDTLAQEKMLRHLKVIAKNKKLYKSAVNTLKRGS